MCGLKIISCRSLPDKCMQSVCLKANRDLKEPIINNKQITTNISNFKLVDMSSKTALKASRFCSYYTFFQQLLYIQHLCQLNQLYIIFHFFHIFLLFSNTFHFLLLHQPLANHTTLSLLPAHCFCCCASLSPAVKQSSPLVLQFPLSVCCQRLLAAFPPSKNAKKSVFVTKQRCFVVKLCYEALIFVAIIVSIVHIALQAVGCLNVQFICFFLHRKFSLFSLRLFVASACCAQNSFSILLQTTNKSGQSPLWQWNLVKLPSLLVGNCQSLPHACCSLFLLCHLFVAKRMMRCLWASDLDLDFGRCFVLVCSSLLLLFTAVEVFAEK